MTLANVPIPHNENPRLASLLDGDNIIMDSV